MITQDPELIAKVADEFVRVLKEWATPEEWRAMLADNARERSATVCHSHDFCDANMAMDAAFRKYDLEPLPHMDVDDPTPEQDADKQSAADFWNAAWEKAWPDLGGNPQ